MFSRAASIPHKTERTVLDSAGLTAMALVLILALRIFSFAVQKWDSDETQHLHVVWEWAHGAIGYRDFFDNHCPLFQLLSVPLFLLCGERPDIVTLMRWVNLPLFLAALWSVYRLGSALFSRRVGVASAVVLGLFPPFFFKAGEFRPDNLWNVEWLLALVLLLGDKPKTWRIFGAGLLLGAAFATSMKTVLLLTILGTAGLFYLLLRTWPAKSRMPPDRATPKVGFPKALSVFLAGLCVFPALLISFFSYAGILGPARYCLLEHNLVATGPFWHFFVTRIVDLRFWLFVPAGWLAYEALRREADPVLARNRAWFFLITGFFCTILWGFWPEITLQDYLPFFPLAAIVLAYLVQRLAETPALARNRRFFSLTIAALCCLQFGWLAWLLWKERDANTIEFARIREILQLTRPDEKVFDAKGEAIFRSRPAYWVYEILTRERMARGQLKDDMPERLIATETAVGIPFHFLTKRTEQFLQANYLLRDRLLVLGQHLALTKDGTAPFKIAVTGTYTFLDSKGPVPGQLDGHPVKTDNRLETGLHVFKPEQPSAALDILWSRAWHAGLAYH